MLCESFSNWAIVLPSEELCTKMLKSEKQHQNGDETSHKIYITDEEIIAVYRKEGSKKSWIGSLPKAKPQS